MAIVTINIPLDGNQIQEEVNLGNTANSLVQAVSDYLDSKKSRGRGGLTRLEFRRPGPTVVLNLPANRNRTLLDLGIVDGSVLNACKSYIFRIYTMFSHSSIVYRIYGGGDAPAEGEAGEAWERYHR